MYFWQSGFGQRRMFDCITGGPQTDIPMPIQSGSAILPHVDNPCKQKPFVHASLRKVALVTPANRIPRLVRQCKMHEG
jgi:hypothetical protein